MRKLIDQKIGFANGADGYKNAMSLNATIDSEENRLYKYIPEAEFMELQTKGFEDNHEELQKEKLILSECINELCQHLNNHMVDTIEKLRQLDKDEKIMSNCHFTSEKLMRIKDELLDLPLTKIGPSLR